MHIYIPRRSQPGDHCSVRSCHRAWEQQQRGWEHGGGGEGQRFVRDGQRRRQDAAEEEGTTDRWCCS